MMRCERCNQERWCTVRYRPTKKETVFDWLYKVLGFKSDSMVLCDECYEKEKVIL